MKPYFQITIGLGSGDPMLYRQNKKNQSWFWDDMWEFKWIRSVNDVPLFSKNKTSYKIARHRFPLAFKGKMP